LELDPAALAGDIRQLAEAVGEESARGCVLTGGEEHTLLATFPTASVPAGWRVIGAVAQGSGVFVGGREPGELGWDHFGSAKSD
jgi:thiamine-monophosphate kinase